MLLQVAHQPSQLRARGLCPLADAVLGRFQAIQGQGQRHVRVEELLSEWDRGRCASVVLASTYNIMHPDFEEDSEKSRMTTGSEGGSNFKHVGQGTCLSG